MIILLLHMSRYTYKLVLFHNFCKETCLSVEILFITLPQKSNLLQSVLGWFNSKQCYNYGSNLQIYL